MGIFSRLSDIVNANINSMLDKAEDPEKMVRLIIQEMEDTLIEVRSSSAKILAERREITRSIEGLEGQVQHWEGNARLALSKDREDLARAALQEKQLIQADLDALEGELKATDDHIDHLQDEIAQLQAKLSEAKARQQTIVMRERTVESRIRVKRQIQREALDSAFSRFEHFERKMDRLEGELDSLDLGAHVPDLASEIEALAADDALTSELEALKASVGKVAAEEKNVSPKTAKSAKK
jgi:phage shock protein A